VIELHACFGNKPSIKECLLIDPFDCAQYNLQPELLARRELKNVMAQRSVGQPYETEWRWTERMDHRIESSVRA
jgi:hypothetical protein